MSYRTWCQILPALSGIFLFLIQVQPCALNVGHIVEQEMPEAPQCHDGSDILAVKGPCAGHHTDGLLAGSVCRPAAG